MTQAVRNIGVIAHIDAGKTTLSERMLFYTRKIHRMGEVHDGTATMDYLPEEQERGITITSACTTCEWNGTTVNIIDTPGHVDFNYEVSRSLAACEGALLVVDATQGVEAQTLANVYLALDHNHEIIPVLNKIDLPSSDVERVKSEIEEDIGLDCSKALPVSAKTGDGVEELLKELDKFAVESPALFPEGVTTDQPEKQVCAELIREKLLLNLEREVPHGTAVEITRFSERDDGIIDLEATIYCEKASHKGIIIGKHGAMLKKIGEDARKDIEEFMGTKVFLQTWVKVKEKWRDSNSLLRNFGYTDT